MNAVEQLAKEIRIETLKCLKKRGFGHVGGSLSVIELLAVLYGEKMTIDPANPDDPERDYLILSKGHAGPALFATLALKGYFPLDWLATMSEPGTLLPSHADRNKTPGIDITTGSLGQGLSIGAGLVQGFSLLNQTNRCYVILGDGECAEGQIWEAAQYAAHYKLKNLVAFVDWNKRQVDGFVEDILAVGNLAEKFKAFGWNALTVKGDDLSAISGAIDQLDQFENEQPTAIILDGVKGSGVKQYEEMEFNHHFALDQAEITAIIQELEEELKQ